MSQAGMINTAAGPVPPSVPTSFVTDVNSPSIPIANVENVFGGKTTANNINGIRTDGSSGSNTLTVQITNKITGSVTTNNAIATTIATFPLNTNVGPGTYLFDFHCVAYNITDGLSAVYETQFGCRFDGVNGHALSPIDDFTAEEGTMINSILLFSVTGSPTLTITVQGLAGKTIDWFISGNYFYVS